MKNMTMKTTKTGKLVIEIDLKKRVGPSASGKTMVVASTAGNKQVPGTDIYIGLNAYSYSK